MKRLNVDATGLERGARGSFHLPLSGGHRGMDIKNYEGEQFACHFHPEAELTLILSGEMYYRAHDTEYLLRAGDAVFVNANVMHAGRSCNGASGIYMPMNFWPVFVSGHEESRIGQKYVAPLLREGVLPYVVLRADREEDAAMLLVVKEIAQIMGAREEGWELLVKAALCRLWHFFYLVGKERGEVRADTGAEAVKRAISFIEAHYAEHLTLAQLAEASHLSRSEFCRTFRRFTGRTAFAYLQYYRVRRSLILLQDHTLSVTDVALQTGFSGASYYAEIFHRFMGVSPLAYRKNVTVT